MFFYKTSRTISSDLQLGQAGVLVCADSLCACAAMGNAISQAVHGRNLQSGEVPGFLRVRAVLLFGLVLSRVVPHQSGWPPAVNSPRESECCSKVTCVARPPARPPAPVLVLKSFFTQGVVV